MRQRSGRNVSVAVVEDYIPISVDFDHVLKLGVYYDIDRIHQRSGE
jgi:hypothetical protein